MTTVRSSCGAITKIRFSLESLCRSVVIRNPPADIDEIQAFLGTVTKGGKRAMVDLCALASKAYFHPDTKGSSSIKKVLPAILKVNTSASEHLQPTNLRRPRWHQESQLFVSEWLCLDRYWKRMETFPTPMPS